MNTGFSLLANNPQFLLIVLLIKFSNCSNLRSNQYKISSAEVKKHSQRGKFETRDIISLHPNARTNYSTQFSAMTVKTSDVKQGINMTHRKRRMMRLFRSLMMTQLRNTLPPFRHHSSLTIEITII